jgi:phage shock protein A
MSIFSRFSDIVNSNINSILDKAEDPEKMVRLIIQEMEDTLVEVRSTSARALADKKEVARRLERLQAEAQDWQSKAELAISKDREDLARSALVEKSKCEESVASLHKELSHIDEHIDKLQSEIGQLQDKLQDAKNRQQAIIMRQKTVSSRLQVKSKLDSHKVDDALSRFDRYERKIDDLEAQVDAYDLGNKSLADEFAELEAGGKVDDELAALKAKMNKSTKKAPAKK